MHNPMPEHPGAPQEPPKFSNETSREVIGTCKKCGAPMYLVGMEYNGKVYRRTVHDEVYHKAIGRIKKWARGLSVGARL